MEFESAYETRHNTIITLDNIISSDDLEVLRKYLKCPTEGCTADLIYVAASPHPFLSAKSHKTSPHVKNCPHFKEKTDSVKEKERYQKVLAAFDEQAISSRLDSLKDDMFPNRIKQERGKPKNRKKKLEMTEQTDTDAGIIVVASSEGEINPDEIKGRRVIKGRITKKKLTEFLQEDEGLIFKAVAQLDHIKKESDFYYNFMVHQIDGKKEANLRLTNSFFKRNIIGINTQLDFLISMLEAKMDIKIAFTGRFDNYESCEFEIFDDYGFKLGTIDKSVPRLDSLVLFYNRYNNS